MPTTAIYQNHHHHTPNMNEMGLLLKGLITTYLPLPTLLMLSIWNYFFGESLFLNITDMKEVAQLAATLISVASAIFGFGYAWRKVRSGTLQSEADVRATMAKTRRENIDYLIKIKAIPESPSPEQIDAAIALYFPENPEM